MLASFYLLIYKTAPFFIRILDIQFIYFLPFPQHLDSVLHTLAVLEHHIKYGTCMEVTTSLGTVQNNR